MATLSQLTSQRATAGARYTAAVTELHAALVDLAALDRVLANRNVNPTPSPAPTFSDMPDSLPWSFAHPVYAPRYPVTNWRDEAAVSAATYLASYSGS